MYRKNRHQILQFKSQTLSIKHNFFELDGKVTNLGRLLLGTFL